MSYECLGCFYFGKPSDAPESVEDDCMYIPTEDDVDDDGFYLSPPCMRDDV